MKLEFFENLEEIRNFFSVDTNGNRASIKYNWSVSSKVHTQTHAYTIWGEGKTHTHAHREKYF